MLLILTQVKLNLAGLIAIIAACIVAIVFFIILPILFFQNKPRRGVVSLEIKEQGSLALTDNLAEYFESVHVYEDRVIFTRKNEVEKAVVQLVMFKEDGSKYASSFELVFEGAKTVEVEVNNRESKIVGANAAVTSVNGKKLRTTWILGQKFIFKLLLAIGQALGCIFVAVFLGISINFFVSYNPRYELVYIIGCLSAVSAVVFILFDRVFSNIPVGGKK